MKIARFRPTGDRLTQDRVSVGIVEGDSIQPLGLPAGEIVTLQELLEVESVTETARSLADSSQRSILLEHVELLPPIDQQEVWAAGVTYKRSQTARMEESEAAASCYDRVYQSPRPELFFKATPHRVAGPSQAVRIRQDAHWNVPEPEITLVLNSRLELVGYTIGNDMSSRDIEGDNPLYLPQAKLYDQCCGLGPWVTTVDEIPARETMTVELVISRHGETVYRDTTSAGQMARTFEELIAWLGRDNSFPNGVFLLTGTGIVPDSDFTLLAEDRIDITIEGLGTLTNVVVQK